jgi:nicotinate-nucleotide pyrophosphorylase (carboxylating)
MSRIPDLERRAAIDGLVTVALEEDVGSGDWTTLWTVPPVDAEAVVAARERLVVAGTEPARLAFLAVGPDLQVEVEVGDGGEVEPGTAILRLHGPARAILTAGSTALNFLRHLSGVATLTRRFSRAVEGTGARVIDTRKTTPGWRILEREAVRAGGGANHRMGLHDMVRISRDHIAAAGGLRPAVDGVRASNFRGLAVEVEVTDLQELDQAFELGVDRVFLVKMTPDRLREAAERVRCRGGPSPELEAAADATVENVRRIAETGVDFVRVDALTQSAPAADLTLRFVRVPWKAN